ncbi:hypothetical protein [Streptomyces shenzhenensis]|uniref:Uncharacterized protein n=1 Tax=Streptomyces shenzhenensis TaxID=943815 RepID=A0A3M0IC00_9ACTN|nr:hypothetical protein [Streptomyces shenzhenensis]RMB85590.1 hypothetical protein CTZ28_12415 [Streptomyces shenzhenensis]
MTISSLALAAKKVIDAAWLHGDAYDLASQAAFALESAQLLMSPETAQELERLRSKLAELAKQVEAARAVHAKFPDSEHCQHDAEPWPCPTVAALVPVDGITRRIAPTQAHVTDDAEAPTLTVFRAQHDLIVMGHYTTDAEARKHCEAEERRSWLTGTNLAFDWIEDEEDGVAELTIVAGQNEESTTGYVVTSLEIASEYDEGADE